MAAWLSSTVPRLDTGNRPSKINRMTLCGVLNVNKPAGVTSRRVVDRVERLVRPTKVGHAGTLDPLATGVLVICVGQATRLIQYVQRMPKTYVATFQLGVRSETDDSEGEVVPVESANEPSRADVERVLASFVGNIQQRPPAHSAVKLSGHRAYKLARRGLEVEIKPRAVAIYRIELRRFEYPELEIEVECGSGTYIRALGRDLGDALATGAVMTALERRAIGEFRAADAVSPEELTREVVRERMQPAIAGVANLPRVTLTRTQIFELRHGRPILRSWLTGASLTDDVGDIAAVDSSGQLNAILFEKSPNELWPRTNFTAS